MRTQLLGLPLKQAEAILSEEGVHPQVSETYAPRREKRANCALCMPRTTAKSSWPRGFSTRFPIRNRKQTDTAGFVGAALCEARLLD